MKQTCFEAIDPPYSSMLEYIMSYIMFYHIHIQILPAFCGPIGIFMLAHKTMASMTGAPAKFCEARLEDFGDGKAGNHGGHQLGVSKRSNIGHCPPKIIYAKSSKIKLFAKSSKLKWP